MSVCVTASSTLAVASGLVRLWNGEDSDGALLGMPDNLPGERSSTLMKGCEGSWAKSGYMYSLQ